MNKPPFRPTWLVAGAIILLGIFGCEARPLGVPSSEAWKNLQFDESSVGFADGMQYDPSSALGTLRTAEAERKLAALRARYTLSDGQIEHLDDLFATSKSLSQGLSEGGSTPENCFKAIQLVDRAIELMDAS
jgi:hypothetical protein